MSAWLLVALGGALGSVLRYGLGRLLMHGAPVQAFPYGTLAVNLLGCLTIGLVAEFLLLQRILAPQPRLLLQTGILGGFTTFSAFGLETVLMLRREQWLAAVTYVSTSVFGGLLAVWLGMKAADGLGRLIK